MTSAALISGFVLMFLVPGGDGGAMLKWHGFTTRAACAAAAPDILGWPVNAGALVLSDCEPGAFAPDGSGDVSLGGAGA